PSGGPTDGSSAFILSLVGAAEPTLTPKPPAPPCRVWPDIWYLQASGAWDSGYAFVTTVRIAPASNSSARCLSISAEGCMAIIFACTLRRAAPSPRGGVPLAARRPPRLGHPARGRWGRAPP